MREELILEIIKERWSPYCFSQVPVEPFKIKAMLEAAGYAPSARNEQPWMFIYTTRDDGVIFNDYLEFLVETNRNWAQSAYALLITLARTKYSATGNPNRYALYDTGMAVSNLLLQAYALDVYAHQMGGFDVEKVRKYFKLDESVEPVAMMAIGYLGDGSTLLPEYVKRDETRRPRRPLNEYAFRNRLP
jgi:nitroreductase